MQTQQPKTLIETISYFSNEQTCIDAVASMRWIDRKPVCSKCGAKRQTASTTGWRLKSGGSAMRAVSIFSVKQGTIFEDSPIELSKWMCALWLLVSCKTGVSSYEIARDLGITQKSAWFVLQRFRFILKTVTVEKMGDSGTPIQMDESFHGGKPKNMHRSRRLKRQVGTNGYAEKTAVFRMIETGTR